MQAVPNRVTLDVVPPAPIVVHPPLGTGGRRVTARGQILGLAHSDADVVEFLRRAGLPDAEGCSMTRHG